MRLILVVALIALLTDAFYFGGAYSQSALRQMSIFAEHVQNRIGDSEEASSASLSDSVEFYKPVEG